VFDPGRIERLGGQIPFAAAALAGSAADLDLVAGRHPSAALCFDAVATGYRCGKRAAQAPRRPAALYDRQFTEVPRRVGDQ